MNLARILDDYLDALSNSRLALRSPTIFIPFIAFGLLQCVIVTLLAFFATPPFSAFMPGIVGALGGEPALHYPTHFVLLPATYRWVYLPLVATVGFALWSYATWSMIGHLEIARRLPARSFQAALPAVVLIGVIFVATTVGIATGLGVVAAKLPAGIPAKLGTLVVIVVTAGAQSLLVYAPVALRIRGEGPISAVRSGARFAVRNFGATALLIATVLAAHLPLDGLISNADRIVGRFNPESIFQLMIASIALEVVTAFVLFAGVVALALPEEGGMQ